MLTGSFASSYHGSPRATQDIDLKLEWSKLGGSQRQVEDAAAILRIRAGELYLDYIETWERTLELGGQWDAARRAAGVIGV
jgi:hypothetical protein